jgi:rsbT co-antagonist protein RsbR
MDNELQDFFEHCPALVFIAKDDGTLVQTSATLRESIGEPASLVSLAIPDDRETVEGFLRILGESGEPASCTFRIADEAGAHNTLRCDARRSATGSIHGQLEIVVSTNDQIEKALLRALLETLDIVVWAIDTDGIFVFQDGKALAAAGLAPGQFLGMNCFELYPPELTELMRSTFDGSESHTSSEAHGVHWETWYVPLRAGNDEVTHCVGVTLNITPAIETQQELERQLQTILEQQRAIQELSAPVIQIWDHVLTVPLIGHLDESRMNELTEQLLTEVGSVAARFAILDLAGVEALDTSTAGHLLRLLGSLRLLGVSGMITGISPQAAHTMVGLGVEFGTFQTYRSLREGLNACMLALGKPRSGDR